MKTMYVMKTVRITTTTTHAQSNNSNQQEQQNTQQTIDDRALDYRAPGFTVGENVSTKKRVLPKRIILIRHGESPKGTWTRRRINTRLIGKSG